MALSVKTTVIKDDWNKIKKQLQKIDGTYTKAGLFGEGTDPASNLAYRGTIQEYGSTVNKIPSRPFTKHAFESNRNKIEKMALKLYEKVIDKKLSGLKAARYLGPYLVGLIRKSIKNGPWQANAASTIRIKGSSRPLIDTGEMWQSVQSKEGKSRT